jgi:hypothetical protein
MPKISTHATGPAKPRKKAIRSLTLGPPHSRDLACQDRLESAGSRCALAGRNLQPTRDFSDRFGAGPLYDGRSRGSPAKSVPLDAFAIHREVVRQRTLHRVE